MNNRLMARLFVLGAVLLFLAGPGFCSEKSVAGGVDIEEVLRSVAQPELNYPNGETIHVSAGKPVRFRWKPASGQLVQINYVLFSLYKGTQMDRINLVESKTFSDPTYVIEVPGRKFEDGQTYTWSITQVFFHEQKSNSQSASFKVVKEAKNK